MPAILSSVFQSNRAKQLYACAYFELWTLACGVKKRRSEMANRRQCQQQHQQQVLSPPQLQAISVTVADAAVAVPGRFLGFLETGQPLPIDTID